MKKLLYLVFCLLCLSIAPGANAQGAASFMKYYGAPFPNAGNYSFDLVQTKDRGFAFTGVTLVTSGATNVLGKMMLYKTDEQGNLMWVKNISLSVPCNDANGYALRELADSSLIIAGTCGYQLVLVHTDKNGDSLWTSNINAYAGTDVNIDLSMNGGFIVSGSSAQTGSKAELFKISHSGQLEWSRQYDYDTHMITNDVRQTADSGYVLLCTSGMAPDALIIKTDKNGDTLWTRRWNETGGPLYMNNILQTSDGGYIFTGGTVFHGMIAKIDNAGMNSWWLDNPAFLGYGIYEDTGKAWYTNSWNNNYLPAFQKIKLDGSSIEWSRIYGHYTPNYAGGFTYTADGGFMLNGYGNDSINGTMAFLIKTDTTGNLTTGLVEPPGKELSFDILPNPAGNDLFISCDQAMEGKLLLINAAGQTIQETMLEGKSARIDISGLPAGVYYAVIRPKDAAGKWSTVKKFVKL